MWKFLLVLTTMFGVTVLSAQALTPLVSPTWVAQHSHEATVRFLDVRDTAVYQAGHLPNAVHLDSSTLRARQPGMGSYLPAPESQAVLAGLGLRDGQEIIVYGDGTGILNATMVAYVLDTLGVPNVAVLDGGWSSVADQAVTILPPTPGAGTLTAQAHPEITATLEDVKAALGKPGVKFIDIRSAVQFAGTDHSFPRNGHIPGAVNLPWMTLMNPANVHQFTNIADMQAVLDAKGIMKTDEVIVYCNTGVTATAPYYALHHILGYPNVRVYEGSWMEYSAHIEMPVAEGN